MAIGHLSWLRNIDSASINLQDRQRLIDQAQLRLLPHVPH